MNKKKEYLMTLAKRAILPNAYQEVEYIEANGTQYIDTGIKFDLGFTLKAKIMFTQQLSDETLTGVRLHNSDGITNGYNWKWEHCGINGSTYWQIAYFTSWYNVSSPATALNTIYEVESNLSQGSQYLKVDGTQIITQTNSNEQLPYVNYAKLRNLFIFARSGEYGVGTSSNFFYGRVYSYKLEKNGAVVFNAIPCYRKLDNEVGMYDLVNGVFYTNQGSGAFNVGGNV